MRLIITGVASTRTLPLPMRGAVCSSPTTSCAVPSRPGVMLRPWGLLIPATLSLRRQTRKFTIRPEMTPRVLILGCGFGGLWAAQALRKAPVEVTVLDRTNHHLFSPLLYQVATAGLSAPAIAAPIRHVLAKQRNATVLLGEAVSFDLNRREVHLENGEALPYDRLV